MCAMAAYMNWPADFPPILAGVVAAAEGVGARLVVLGNIYGYGKEAPSPLTSALPLAPTSVKGAREDRDVGAGARLGRSRVNKRPRVTPSPLGESIV